MVPVCSGSKMTKMIYDPICPMYGMSTYIYHNMVKVGKKYSSPMEHLGDGIFQVKLHEPKNYLFPPGC